RAHRRGARRNPHHRQRAQHGRRGVHPSAHGGGDGGPMSATILVVDDDERLRETLGVLVRSLGHQAIMAADVPSAERGLAERDLDFVISDLRMPGGSGLDLLARARAAAPSVPVIVLTAYGTVETAVDAMKKGAFDYLQKPFDAVEMELRIARALELKRVRAENDYLREEIDARGEQDELI